LHLILLESVFIPAPGANHGPYYMVPKFFLVVKWPELDVDNSPSSSAEVTKE
jgi:hypothetical protein